ncbi:hypothetical protein Ciccas_000940 [Cichlidogyrus casuarinus]|uniref:Uncharacterized protein n=1 Tax=Cichlidogyrus casuarinus TaxID=1844966 RepID=A0ABD2QLG3_9PLAT
MPRVPSVSKAEEFCDSSSQNLNFDSSKRACSIRRSVSVGAIPSKLQQKDSEDETIGISSTKLFQELGLGCEAPPFIEVTVLGVGGIHLKALQGKKISCSVKFIQ